MKKRPGNGGKRYWRADDGNKFVNPYNFVRLGNGVERSSNAPTEDLVSGSISCFLIAKTPIAIPDFSRLSRNELEGSQHKGLTRPIPFMRVNDSEGVLRPIIPGSEIRGVIRSAFEAVDNGCLSVNNSNVASARHPFPRNPGVLVHEGSTGKWKLYKAKKRTLKNGAKPNPNERIRSWKPAQNKRGEMAFRRLDAIVEAANLEQAVEDYFITLDIYCENDPEYAQYLNNRTPNGTALWSTAQRPSVAGIDEEWPVFYEIVDNIATGEELVYLSPAQMSRSVFRNRVDDLLGGDSPASYKRCNDPNNVCESCRLFGMVGEGGALASKIRFSDAILDLDKETGFAATTLKELSGPKTSAVEFYTERPDDALTWTYDYKTTGYQRTNDFKGKSRVEPERELLSGSQMIKLRGRKFYLHHNHSGSPAEVDKAILAECSTDEKTDRNMTVEVALSGNTFYFDVFFEGITKIQLDKLIWTLCIGENDADGLQMHKIGHGKPLGLGSAKIVVDKLAVRNVDGAYIVNESQQVVPKKADELFGLRNISVQDYLVITNYDLTKGLHVSYPIADANPFAGKNAKPNDKASHQWFIANRNYGPDSDNFSKQDIAYELPHMPETVADGAMLQLPKFTKDSLENQKRTGIARPTKKQVFPAPEQDSNEVLTPMQIAMRKAGLY